VAANKGIRHAFEKALNMPVIVPEHYDVMGAVGAAILAREKVSREKTRTKFKGFRFPVQTLSPKASNAMDVPTIARLSWFLKISSLWVISVTDAANTTVLPFLPPDKLHKYH